MRRRYLRSTMLLVAIGMSVLAVIMAAASSNGIRGEAQDRLNAEAVRIAAVVHQRIDAGLPVGQAFTDDSVPADREVQILLPDGSTVTAGEPISGSAISAQAELTVPGGGSVTVLESPERVQQSQLISTLSIVGIVLGVGVVALLVALRESRRLTQPLSELADRASRLGEGDLRPVDQRFGMAELDRLADALDESAAQISRTSEASRARVVDVSHQLRTPLTALSMRLEEISRGEDLGAVHEEAAAALQQVERLTGVVDAMLVDAEWGGR
ncbi:MAG: histidine kinase dimerization/phospho-acceptor domain-containing protein, partial [Actinomycetes bacterium]